tara:strand:+ start:262 stop:708 length:447 start_codon:yes stop_codon:yes gene_type:complete
MRSPAPVECTERLEVLVGEQVFVAFLSPFSFFSFYFSYFCYSSFFLLFVITFKLRFLLVSQGVLFGKEFSRAKQVECEKTAPLSDILRVHDYGYLHDFTEFCMRIPKPNSETGKAQIALLDRGDTTVSHFTAIASLRAAGCVLEAVDR